ncbi:hypothetical protein BABINDRAFT_106280 [Babjeviella inositovora NRRL Y-12698]|uniref:Uncharacterized protein n=1 Tax=Babjeviella inositovora NRRL Y-12698 TaxID=984486 RepID=A0A1E3QH31_9ASCO|nr:uncharacterized protein BABINDRAFT_106280 [Babjeviella inositovora NRRL Y-12698]ODQ77005.1 hypothetical protein BABINDRAFT_106280 [Babjeviella inositovora NRRL Y-12698]
MCKMPAFEYPCLTVKICQVSRESSQAGEETLIKEWLVRSQLVYFSVHGLYSLVSRSVHC